MDARSDIAKCLGEDNRQCAQCTRRLAPSSGSDQQWTQPIEDEIGQCVLFFPAATYRVLYEQERLIKI